MEDYGVVNDVLKVLVTVWHKSWIFFDSETFLHLLGWTVVF